MLAVRGRIHHESCHGYCRRRRSGSSNSSGSHSKQNLKAPRTITNYRGGKQQ